MLPFTMSMRLCVLRLHSTMQYTCTNDFFLDRYHFRFDHHVQIALNSLSYLLFIPPSVNMY